MTFGLAQMEPEELVPYRRYRALGAVYVTLNLLFIFLLIALQELLDNKEKAKDFGEHDDVARLCVWSPPHHTVIFLPCEEVHGRKSRDQVHI